MEESCLVGCKLGQNGIIEHHANCNNIRKKLTSFEAIKVYHSYFPVFIKSENYKMLLAVQTEPETKYFFKDKEISIDELIEKLEEL